MPDLIKQQRRLLIAQLMRTQTEIHTAANMLQRAYPESGHAAELRGAADIIAGWVVDLEREQGMTKAYEHRD